MFGLLGQVIGIIIIIIGGLLTFFLHAPEEHQPPEFGVSFVVIGIILIIIGGVLLLVA
jgi:hypothetical protein